MIKRYSTIDIPEIKEFFAGDDYEYVVLVSSLDSANMLYFDIWLSTDDLGITAVIFRTYGHFFLKYNERASVEELSGFISFMPMLDTLCLSPAGFDDFACLLKGIVGVSHAKICKQTDPTLLQKHDLYFKTTATASSYRDVHKLLKISGIPDIPTFDNYYFLRKGFDKNKTGRTYFLESGDRVYSTASTTGEIEELALVTDVVTDSEFERRGLASAIVSKLCIDLREEGRTPVVVYINPYAKGLYEKLGFTEIGERMIARFK